MALPKWAQPAACSGCRALSRSSSAAQGLTPRVGSHAAAAKTSSLYDLSKARGVQWASGGAPGGLKMGAFLLAFCGNCRPVRSLFLFRLYFVCAPPFVCHRPPPPPPALQMAALTWLGVGGQVSFVRPPPEEFPEKATQDSGYSPGILEGAPSLRRGGPGESTSIYLGLQGSKQIRSRRDFRVLSS